MKSAPDSPAFEIVQTALIGTIILLFWMRRGISLCLQNGLKGTSSTNRYRKRAMKNWIIIMTVTKEMKCKDNNRIYFALTLEEDQD